MDIVLQQDAGSHAGAPRVVNIWHYEWFWHGEIICSETETLWCRCSTGLFFARLSLRMAETSWDLVLLQVQILWPARHLTASDLFHRFIYILCTYVGVSLNDGTSKTPQNDHFLQENPWLLGTTATIFGNPHVYNLISFRNWRTRTCSFSLWEVIFLVSFFQCR